VTGPRLLVSVRSPAEAEAALAGGADLIDVKEPTRGPLGRADEATVAAVIRQVAGRRPVSAALGELADGAPPCRAPGLTYVKWGLADWGQCPDWRDVLLWQAEAAGGARVVAAAYADWRLAGAPPPEEVFDFARRSGGVLLLDTWRKEPLPGQSRAPSLLDWLPAESLTRLCERCRAAGVAVALAGSLGLAQVTAVLAAGADWLAVRGAACEGGRDGTVSERRVRELVALLGRRSTV
jgi:uncharacterized protein (UPF0264 family)